MVDRILEQVRHIQRCGGLVARTAVNGRTQQRLFYPMVMFVACDNKEAQVLASVKSGSTTRPCRVCKIERVRVNTFNDRTLLALRSRQEVVRMTNDGRLDWLKSHSIHTDVPVRLTT